MEARWTLDELVRRVDAALAGPAYPGPPNGRVRDVPDKRAVRWYATIGLVDRPTAMQGRTALYGTRHLLQIVAVKRRQAQGRSLAEIQAELAGATDRTLRRVAAVSDELIAAAPQPPKPRPEPLAQREPAAFVEKRPVPSPRARGRFWAQPAADAGADSVTILAAVGLPGGAMVLLPGQPSEDDLAPIRAAAGPLLDVLADRGLLSPEERS
jgi:DNA-binding transcriptional MerR regulator